MAYGRLKKKEWLPKTFSKEKQNKTQSRIQKPIGWVSNTRPMRTNKYFLGQPDSRAMVQKKKSKKKQ